MITIKLPITTSDVSFILMKQKDYSGAFRKLYKNIDKINDQEYLKYLSNTYKLSPFLINCLKIDVNTKFEQVSTLKTKLEKDINDLIKTISKIKEQPKTNKTIRTLFKLNKKLEYKNRSLSKDITFGKLSLLREITYLNNVKNNLLNIDNKKDELNKTIEKLNLKKKEYKNNRLLPVSYYGSLNDSNSNRHFIFNFNDNKIIFKPVFGVKIEINYKVNKNYKEILSYLQKVKDSKLLPITIKLTTKHIFISIDNEFLTDFKFNMKEYKRELKEIPKEDKLLKKQIYIKYIHEKENRMFKNKNKNRYCGIDLNPEYIGLSILDRVGDDYKIIYKKTYDLTELMNKSGKSSDDKLSVYINNKRKHEIGRIYKSIFRTLKHFKVSHFITEDLNFNDKNKEFNKEFNRKTKNIWNLNLQFGLINKHCKDNGIKLDDVSPVYTSFIGNIMYNDFDPVNASIEICRRGIFKYNKGNFYPELTYTILDTVVDRFTIPDVHKVKECKDWRTLFLVLKETKCRYRWRLDDLLFSRFSHQNIKSKVKIIKLLN